MPSDRCMQCVNLHSERLKAVGVLSMKVENQAFPLPSPVTKLHRDIATRLTVCMEKKQPQ